MSMVMAMGPQNVRLRLGSTQGARVPCTGREGMWTGRAQRSTGRVMPIPYLPTFSLLGSLCRLVDPAAILGTGVQALPRVAVTPAGRDEILTTALSKAEEGPGDSQGAAPLLYRPHLG